MTVWNLILILVLTWLALVLPLTIAEANLEEDNPIIYWMNSIMN